MFQSVFAKVDFAAAPGEREKVLEHLLQSVQEITGLIMFDKPMQCKE